MLNVDIEKAIEFLQRLAGDTLITFQTFSDSKVKGTSLNTIMHGTGGNTMAELVKLNGNGAGVFVMVNEGDGKGRKTENVVRVRAVFIDLDGEPLPEKWKLAPHITVESSPGRFHAYWVVSDCALNEFSSIQKALAQKYNGDASVTDLPRVMRVPGFIHQKDEPVKSKILTMDNSPAYTIQQIMDGLGLVLNANPVKSAKSVTTQAEYLKGSKEGSRTACIVKYARSLSRRDAYSEEEAVDFCLVFDLHYNKPPLEDTDPGKVEKTVRDVYKRYVYTEIPDFVVELNENYFVTKEGNKTVVCEETFDIQLRRRMLHRYTFSDFRNFHDNKKVDVGMEMNGKKIVKGLGSAWLDSEHRRQYKGVIMVPLKATPGYYNLWKGFAFSPQKGTWAGMKNHILNIICSGDKNIFGYVMGWLAWMIQKPEVPGEVALVLQGGKGVGKGILGNALCTLIAQHSCHITNGKHLTGNFNAHLEGCIFLFVDEAHWAGDKAGENVLKGLITEPTVPVEKKFFDLKEVPNMLHIMMASNNDWVVPASLDERRYCVLKVSDTKIGDKKYFKAIVDEMKVGGYEAMLQDLLDWDISGFDVRDFPQTDGLLEQKLHGLDAETSWWFQKLQAGEINSGLVWEQIPTKTVHDDYCDTTSKLNSQSRRASETKLGMALNRLLPKGWPQKKPHKPNYGFADKRVMHYLFPPLKVCRKHFEGLIGTSVDWDEVHLEEGSVSDTYSCEL